jgi:hypothetical protein
MPALVRSLVTVLTYVADARTSTPTPRETPASLPLFPFPLHEPTSIGVRVGNDFTWLDNEAWERSME